MAKSLPLQALVPPLNPLISRAAPIMFVQTAACVFGQLKQRVWWSSSRASGVGYEVLPGQTTVAGAIAACTALHIRELTPQLADWPQPATTVTSTYTTPAALSQQRSLGMMYPFALWHGRPMVLRCCQEIAAVAFACGGPCGRQKQRTKRLRNQ